MGDQVTHGRIRHSELAQKRTRVKGAIEKHACYRLLQNCPVGQLGEVYASSSKALSTARKPTMTLQGSQDKAPTVLRTVAHPIQVSAFTYL